MMKDKLTREEALKQLDKIRASVNDPESAHSYEDSLHSWFIQCVADGMYKMDESIEIAKIVKETSEINFQRWCA